LRRCQLGKDGNIHLKIMLKFFKDYLTGSFCPRRIPIFQVHQNSFNLECEIFQLVKIL
jgi:hypothetical protein